MNAPAPVQRIVSGGQTGVDRAALDVAIELNIEHGGWCPHGRLAEDGVIPSRYQLSETQSSKLDVRTRRNVRDSDGTLIIASRPLTGGTALTERVALRVSKPVLITDPNNPDAPANIITWLDEHNIATLNVAGPRASSAPNVYHNAARLLQAFLTGPPAD